MYPIIRGYQNYFLTIGLSTPKILDYFTKDVKNAALVLYLLKGLYFKCKYFYWIYSVLWQWIIVWGSVSTHSLSLTHATAILCHCTLRKHILYFWGFCYFLCLLEIKQVSTNLLCLTVKYWSFKHYCCVALSL